MFIFVLFSMSFLGKKSNSPKERSLSSIVSTNNDLKIFCTQSENYITLNPKGLITGVFFQGEWTSLNPTQNFIVQSGEEIFLNKEGNQLKCYFLNQLHLLKSSFTIDIDSLKPCFNDYSSKEGFFFSYFLSPRVEFLIIYNDQLKKIQLLNQCVKN